MVPLLYGFDKYFLSDKAIGETDPKLKLFQLRIVGMVSYLGDKTSLMPSIVASPEGTRIHIENTVMSTHQVARYAETRKIERKQETSKKKLYILKAKQTVVKHFYIYIQIMSNN
jgi:hypothetical protein